MTESSSSTIKLTIFSCPLGVAGLADRDFASLAGLPSAPKPIKRKEQQESQIILTKGQLGQFKLMCPPEWEVGADGAKHSRHFVFVGSSLGAMEPTQNQNKAADAACTQSQHAQCLNSAKRGVSQGYAVSLELIGLGYAAEISGAAATPEARRTRPKQQPPLEQLASGFVDADPKPNTASNLGKVSPRQHMILTLGKSHKIFHFVDGKSVGFSFMKNKDNSMSILIFGISRSIVNQTAAEISRYKKPSVYNAKGISVEGHGIARSQSQV